MEEIFGKHPYGFVQGDEEQAKPIVVAKSKVYIHTDIEYLPDEKTWQYREIQYDKDEYLQLMADYINVPTPFEEVKIEKIKEKAIADLRVQIRRELEKGMRWKDKKIYDITEEARDQLKTLLLIGVTRVSFGIKPEDIDLLWGAKDEKPYPWKYFALCELFEDIYAEVTAILDNQRQLEKNIMDAEAAYEVADLLQKVI